MLFIFHLSPNLSGLLEDKQVQWKASFKFSFNGTRQVKKKPLYNNVYFVNRMEQIEL